MDANNIRGLVFRKILDRADRCAKSLPCQRPRLAERPQTVALGEYSYCVLCATSMILTHVTLEDANCASHRLVRFEGSVRVYMRSGRASWTSIKGAEPEGILDISVIEHYLSPPSMI